MVARTSIASLLAVSLLGLSLSVSASRSSLRRTTEMASTFTHNVNVNFAMDTSGFVNATAGSGKN